MTEQRKKANTESMDIVKKEKDEHWRQEDIEKTK